MGAAEQDPGARATLPAGRRRWPAVLAWSLWALVILGLPATRWVTYLLVKAGYPYLVQIGAYDALSLVTLPAVVSAATVGAVLATRRPRHPVGWLLLGLGLSMVMVVLAPQYAWYGHVARPGAVPAPLQVGQFLGNWQSVQVFVIFILLLTPTGSLPSPRWRWLAGILAVASVGNIVTLPFLTRTVLQGDLFAQMGPDIPNPLFVPALAPPQPVVDAWGGMSWGIIMLGVWAAAASLAVRLRRARGVERQQLRWAAPTGVLGGVVALVWAVGAALRAPEVYVTTAVGYVVVMPLIIGAAVLRYRLYDLDRIVSRTIAYGLLTVLLGAGYVGVVLGLGQVLGRDSELAVAGATLAVAAAFQPARRRIQDLVDRRFNRRRYDAARTIVAFSGGLRHKTDLDAVRVDLLDVVEETMQPTHARLWLRPTGPAPVQDTEPR